MCVFVQVKIKEQSTAGLSVPPDVTLHSSGADPATEVGQLTAPLLWVGEDRRERFGLGAGKVWHPC